MRYPPTRRKTRAAGTYSLDLRATVRALLVRALLEEAGLNAKNPDS